MNNSSWKVNYSRYGSKNASIRSARGYILDSYQKSIYKNDDFAGIQHNTEKRNFDPHNENKQYIAAGADITDKNAKTSILTYESTDVQDDQKNTEKCLKRFQDEFKVLLKQRKKKKSFQCSTQNEEAETPTTSNKSIIQLSNCSSKCFSHESLLKPILNFTKLNSNKTVKQAEENNTSTDCFSIDTSSFKKDNQNDDEYNEEARKDMPCNYNELNSHNIDERLKHGKNNNEMNISPKCTESASTVAEKDQKKSKINTEPQKMLVDDTKFYSMLKEFHEDIEKIKSVLTYKNESDRKYNNELGRSEQTEHDDDLTYYIDEDQYSRTDCTDSNMGSWGADEVQSETTVCSHNPTDSLREQTEEGFYQLQPASDPEGENGTVHFFQWQNPHKCQCGMISNKN